MTKTTHENDYGGVQLVGTGPLSETFMRVRMYDITAYILGVPPEYVVWADTLRYRRDGQDDPFDVRELKTLSREVIEGSDDEVSMTLEVKG